MQERGLLILSDGDWERAKQRAKVIGPAEWFRLMQAIHNEVRRPAYEDSSRNVISRVWTEADCCPRAGSDRWLPFESISPHRRRSMLIATAIHLIE